MASAKLATFCARDDQLVLRRAVIDAGGDAEPQQHALHGLERREVRLREPHRNTLGLRALHAAVRVEQAAQEAAVEVARRALDGGRHRVAAFAQAELARQLGDGREAQAELAAVTHFVPAGEVVADAARGVERGRHDGIRTADTHVAVADRAARPDGKLRVLIAHRAVTDQQAHEVPLVVAPILRRIGAGPLWPRGDDPAAAPCRRARDRRRRTTRWRGGSA